MCRCPCSVKIDYACAMHLSKSAQALPMTARKPLYCSKAVMQSVFTTLMLNTCSDRYAYGIRSICTRRPKTKNHHQTDRMYFIINLLISFQLHSQGVIFHVLLCGARAGLFRCSECSDRSIDAIYAPSTRRLCYLDGNAVDTGRFQGMLCSRCSSLCRWSKRIDSDLFNSTSLLSPELAFETKNRISHLIMYLFPFLTSQ